MSNIREIESVHFWNKKGQKEYERGKNGIQRISQVEHAVGNILIEYEDGKVEEVSGENCSVRTLQNNE